MKSLGCFVRDIRKIFLMEAGCIGFAGGLAGVVLLWDIGVNESGGRPGRDIL